MKHIDAVIDLDAYAWLTQYHPAMVDAIEHHLHKGASPEQIRRHVQSVAGPERDALAARCEQCARHIQRIEQD